MSKPTMTVIITLIFAAILAGQLAMIKIAKAKGWTIRIRPFYLLACAVVIVLGLYSILTGNYILG